MQFKYEGIKCGDVVIELAKIPSNSVHLAITSPPYNVGKDYDKHNDKMKYKDSLKWLNNVWKETTRVLVPGGRFCLNIAPTGIKDFTWWQVLLEYCSNRHKGFYSHTPRLYSPAKKNRHDIQD
ncbi:hypothetical protein HYY71_03785 [Candidatus Woesearchaeota archaeon]|nr:hypothetical protein [Candidatus Woesearchaeota archaeon]